MQIRLDQVHEPFDWQETLELDARELDHPQVVALSPIACRGRVSPVDEGHLLRAALAYEQTLRCMRCLEPVVEPVEGEIDLLVLPARAEPTVDERELQAEDLGVLVLDEPLLDTRPLVVDQVQLGVPMKPLCRDDCAGLCSRCGADLNQGPCDCAEEVDPRWAALAGLKRDRD